MSEPAPINKTDIMKLPQNETSAADLREIRRAYWLTEQKRILEDFFPDRAKLTPQQIRRIQKRARDRQAEIDDAESLLQSSGASVVFGPRTSEALVFQLTDTGAAVVTKLPKNPVLLLIGTDDDEDVTEAVIFDICVEIGRAGMERKASF